VAVVARNVRFEPATLDVTAGQKISFDLDNADQIDHNLVSAEAGFQEVILAAGQKKTIEWTAPAKPGMYKIICTYHPGMEMIVNVK
jgi:plastocyanin